MFNILGLIILGLICGALARLIVPGKENFGWIATAVLGVVGAYVGGTLGAAIFRQEFSITPPIEHGLIGGVVGAVIALLVYKKFIVKTPTAT